MNFATYVYPSKGGEGSSIEAHDIIGLVLSIGKHELFRESGPFTEIFASGSLTDCHQIGFHTTLLKLGDVLLVELTCKPPKLKKIKLLNIL